MVQYSYHSYKFQFCKIKNFIKCLAKEIEKKLSSFSLQIFKEGGDPVWTARYQKELL